MVTFGFGQISHNLAVWWATVSPAAGTTLITAQTLANGGGLKQPMSLSKSGFGRIVGYT